MASILIVMRLADMTRDHPNQITARCSKCNEEVAVYPSGQEVMRKNPGVALVCQVCRQRGTQRASLAPGAELEPFETVKRKPKH